VLHFVPVLCLLLSVLLAAAGAWTDLRTGQIPNWLTFPGILVGVVLAGLAGRDGFLLGAGRGVAAAAVCALPVYILFRMGGFGGGDVKMIAAIGALLASYDHARSTIPSYHGLQAMFLSLCAAMVFALARLAWHGKLLRLLSNTLFLVLNPVLPKRWRRELSPDLMTRMRFGGAILAGTFISVLMQFTL
jgi:prepilin peptidase CpaA